MWRSSWEGGRALIKGRRKPKVNDHECLLVVSGQIQL